MNSIQDIISTISWDRRIVTIPLMVKAPHRDLIIMDPTLTQRNYALFIQQRALQESLESGVPSEAELLVMARSAGAWSDEHEKTLEEADETLSRLEGEKAIVKHVVARKMLLSQIHATKQQVKHIRRIKDQFVCQSAEYLARLESIYYLMRETVRCLDQSPVWNSEEHFLQDRENYQEFFSIIATNIATEGMIATNEIRKVARSGEWRLFWTQGRENLVSLFNRTAAEMNINQRSLVYWSKVYDIAFESYDDRPNDDIIADDDRFDEWLHQHLAQKSKDNVSGTKDKIRKAKDHQEQGVIIDGYYLENCTCGVGTKPPKGLGLKRRHSDGCTYGRFIDYTEEEKKKIVDEIYGRNTGVVRAIINKEQKAIDEKGLVDERRLRGKNTRHILGMASNVNPRMRK